MRRPFQKRRQTLGQPDLPPLEAFRLGVPVLYPNEVGSQDQVGNAGILPDLYDPGTMATHLAELLRSRLRRAELSTLGDEMLSQTSEEERLGVLMGILNEIHHRRHC